MINARSECNFTTFAAGRKNFFMNRKFVKDVKIICLSGKVKKRQTKKHPVQFNIFMSSTGQLFFLKPKACQKSKL